MLLKICRGARAKRAVGTGGSRHPAGRCAIRNLRHQAVVQGRKAWLFSNTPRGAESSSAMFSIAETAKENGLNPFRYFTFILEKLPNMTTSDNFEDLLPWSDSVKIACAVGHHDSAG